MSTDAALIIILAVPLAAVFVLWLIDLVRWLITPPLPKDTDLPSEGGK